MDRRLVNRIADRLRKQRKHYLDEFRKAEDDLEAIAEERESELEEHAQEEQSARMLTRLDDRTLHAVQEIDAALQRLLNGNYGTCEACGGMIPAPRLHALPATRYCKDCASQDEKQMGIPVEEAEIPSTGPVPEDLSSLGDSDLTELIHDQMREDSRIDMEELRVVCRKGVVHLSGALPSEPEHQIVLQIITDILGLREVVDRIQVEELLWEQESRTKEKPPEVLAPGQETAGTEDIAESNEEDKEFTAPAEPTPKEERKRAV